MKLSKVTRILALACIVASFPIGALKYPWLPATVIEFVELRRAPVLPSATTSFRTWREGRLRHLQLALGLYALGTAALGGLGAVAAKVVPLWAELVVWIITAFTALEITGFERPDIGARTDPAYIFIMISLPLAVVAIAALGATINIGSLLLRENTAALN